MVFAVAQALGKYPHEVARDMTVFELNHFAAYLQLMNERG